MQLGVADRARTNAHDQRAGRQEVRGRAVGRAGTAGRLATRDTERAAQTKLRDREVRQEAREAAEVVLVRDDVRGADLRAVEWLRVSAERRRLVAADAKLDVEALTEAQFTLREDANVAVVRVGLATAEQRSGGVDRADVVVHEALAAHVGQVCAAGECLRADRPVDADILREVATNRAEVIERVAIVDTLGD